MPPGSPQKVKRPANVVRATAAALKVARAAKGGKGIAVAKKKKKRTNVVLTAAQKLLLLEDYIHSDPMLSIKDLSKKHKVPEYSIRAHIDCHIRSVINRKKSHALATTSVLPSYTKEEARAAKVGNAARAMANIDLYNALLKSNNDEFLELLSEPESLVLTDPEVIFSQLLVLTGNPQTAILDAGLDIGLAPIKASRSKAKAAGTERRLALAAYSSAILIRSEYVCNKANVAKYIMELKQNKYLPESIDKATVQQELLEQLSQIKVDNNIPIVTRHGLRLSVIEQLGKTVSAFTETLRIEQVDPAKALDYLDSLSSAKAEEKKNPATRLIEEAMVAGGA